MNVLTRSRLSLVLSLRRQRVNIFSEPHQIAARTLSSNSVLLTKVSEQTSLNPSQSPPYLPSNYNCSLAWQQRLQAPIFKKLDLDEFFFEIDKKYQPDKVISPIDVDLFVNRVVDEEHLEELEELVHRLRRSPAVSDVLPSTSHAVVRILSELDKTETLFRILNDRMNYGVFIDLVTANLLMDKFLTKGMYKEAATIATLLMLDENFGSSTTKFLTIVSCLKYLEAENLLEQSTDSDLTLDEDAEEVKKRVKYLRNPYFDDHFQLDNPKHLIGKTLAYVSLHVSEDEFIRNSLSVYGWALYDKWGKVEKALKDIHSRDGPISSEIMDRIQQLVSSRLAQIEASPEKTLPFPELKQVAGLNLDPKEVAACFNRLKWNDEAVKPLPSVQDLLTKSSFKIVNDSVLSKTEEYLRKAISEKADFEITSTEEMYHDWETVRTNELDKQLTRIREIKLLLEHQEKKADLVEREDRIFFFDHEEEWMMKLEEKYPKPAPAPPPPTTTRAKKAAEIKKPKSSKKDDDSSYVSPII